MNKKTPKDIDTQEIEPWDDFNEIDLSKKRYVSDETRDKLSKGQFSVIEDFRSVQGDRYDYSKVEYVNARTKVTIICPDHGEFQALPTNHLRGVECLQCTRDRRRLSSDQVIEKFRQFHGDRYDYSEVEYVDQKTLVTIICPEHGEFQKKPYAHKKGGKCPRCVAIERGKRLRGKKRPVSDKPRQKRRNRFWDRYPDLVGALTKVHGDRYDYSKVEYVDYGTPITIICKEHGEFKQLFYYHRKGHGCPKCGDELNASKQTHSQEKVIARFREVHGDKYDYSKVEYVRSGEKVIIICPEHGEFLQTPTSHKSGQGCRACGHIERLKVWKKKKGKSG